MQQDESSRWHIRKACKENKPELGSEFLRFTSGLWIFPHDAHHSTLKTQYLCISMGDVCTKFRQTKCCFEVLQPLDSVISWKNRSRMLNRAQHLSSSTFERGESRLGKISSSFDHFYASTRLA